MSEETYELKQAAIHDKAIQICALFADGVTLEQACKLEGLSASAFFRAKRDNPDVQQAFIEAKEVNAEIRLSRMDELKDRVLDGELDKDIFSAVIKADQWVITKLRPDLFGTRTVVDVKGTIEHTPAKLLSQMSDDQIMKLIAFDPKQSTSSATTDNKETIPAETEPPMEAEFEEISSATQEEKYVDKDDNIIYNTELEPAIVVNPAGYDGPEPVQSEPISDNILTNPAHIGSRGSRGENNGIVDAHAIQEPSGVETNKPIFSPAVLDLSMFGG